MRVFSVNGFLAEAQNKAAFATQWLSGVEYVCTWTKQV